MAPDIPISPLGHARRTIRIVLAAVLLAAISLFSMLPWNGQASVAGVGRILIAGYGPEQRTIQDLAAAYERSHPGSVVDIEWDRNLKAVEMVKAGTADFAVTGYEDGDLTATPIAWDGIAVIVNFSNPVQALTKDQVASIFTGKIRSWAEFDGPEKKIDAIHRPPDTNLRVGFERSLDIAGKTSTSAKAVRSDQRVFSTVAGDLSAISYISLGASLEALQFGIPIRTLLIDSIEPAEPTVKTGSYLLRRPVLLLSLKDSNPARSAFADFVRSPAGQRIVDETFIPYSP